MNKTMSNTTVTPAIHSSASFGTASTLQISVTSFIAFIGVIGNILTCITLMTKHQPFKPPFKQYLVSLAVADIGVLAIAYPLVIVRREMPSGWPFGEYVCRIIFPFFDVFFGASIWAVTAISIQRWRKICLVNAPSNYVMRVITVIWTGSFLIAAVPFYIMVEFDDSGDKIFCFYDWKKLEILHEVYSIALFLYWFGVPLSIISWNYIAIRRKLRKSTEFILSHTLSKQNQPRSVYHRLKQNKQAKRILKPVVIVFAVTMFPLNLFYLTIPYWPQLSQESFFPTIAFLCILLVVVNSSSNPIIYGMVSRKFRNSLRKVLRSAFRKTYRGGHHSERESVERECIV